ncbi:DNA-processing protein DprA [Microbacterium pumilum]|uniref:DNA-processing protein DprA n=1 Tax=Microbacterium pumilum TaxID=344165 RepID=A0ABN2SSM2_9MICO
MSALELTASAARHELAADARARHLDDRAMVERYAVVVWSHLTEPGDGVAGRLIERIGAVEALRVVRDGGGSPVSGMSDGELAAGRKRWMPRLQPGGIATAMRIASTTGVRIVTRADPEWPAQLDDLGEHAPLCLWVRGDPAKLGRLTPSVALVGARAATSYGDHVALELSADLAGGGIPVISGGAYGIDGAAHRAALAVGGLTVALLAGGADRAYPAGHSELIGRIAEHGVVASEVPCGSAPTKWRFLQRNRLIAALSAATVVVEAGWRSGSLNTAAHAAALSRGLGAVPGPITSAASAGSHRLLREFGAQCITSAADVRELLGLDVTPRFVASGGSSEERPPTDDTTRVRDALSTRVWRDAEDVGRRAGIAREDVEAILGLMHLGGEVVRGGGGWRRLSAAARS